jgi:hypothetical protein
MLKQVMHLNLDTEKPILTRIEAALVGWLPKNDEPTN